MSNRILIVDDEIEIANLVALYLKNEGYHVLSCYKAADALKYIQEETLDLAILDIMLPDIDGFQLCQKIREKHQYPVIMLTAKSEGLDKITGLSIGADDYVTKPFEPLELVARVKAQLRRYKQYNTRPQEDDILVHSGLVLDIKAHTCTLNERPLALTPTEFAILQILCQRKGQVVSSEELFHFVWKDEYYSKSNNTITVHIRRLREKMNDSFEIPNISRLSGGAGIKLKTKHQTSGYSTFHKKIMQRFCIGALLSAVVVLGFYLLLWKGRIGEWVVSLMQWWLRIGHEDAFNLYHSYFRDYKDFFFAAAMVAIFLLLLWYLFHWMTRYFKEIDQGIECLITDQTDEIRLSPEMQPFERKLNAVKNTLAQRAQAARDAERKKDEFVLYLAHDIRTPLTSVIGYLDLLEDSPDLPAADRAQYTHIALEKAHRLEKMIQEFFEITRYNTSQIMLAREPVDLYYLLVQAIDEHTPAFTKRGNYVVFRTRETVQVYGDADKLARVFNNLLKNAAAYSEPGTEIIVDVEDTPEQVAVMVSSHGKTIPKDKLNALFEKFYRLDEARTSDTGSSGLGLAIAKEIVTLHGGTITAHSEDGLTSFSVELPVRQSDL